jgi:hypothetical protein
MKKKSLNKFPEGGKIKSIMKRKLPKHQNGALVGQVAGTAIGASTAAIPVVGPFVAPMLTPILSQVGSKLGDQVSGDEAKRKRDEETNKNLMQSYQKLNTVNNPNSTRVNTGSNFQFPYGGEITEDMINPNAELELEETFQTPDGTVGQVNAPSHEEGGIEVNLPEGTRVFSDRLKYKGKTFAKLTKPINSKIAKIEKQLESNPMDYRKKNSLTLLNQQLDHYFNIQEASKKQAETKRSLNTMRKGGLIKYNLGGGTPPDPFNNPVEYQVWLNNQPKSLVQNQLQENAIIPTNDNYLIKGQPRNFDRSVNNNPTFKNNSIATDINNDNNNNFQNNNQNQVNNWTNFAQRTIQPQLTEMDPNQLTNQPASTVTFEDTAQPTTSTSSTKNSWANKNIGNIGQIGSAIGTNIAQNINLNRVKAPRSINPISTASKVMAPQKVNFSANIDAINRQTMGDYEDINRSFANSATARAFKNKARLNQAANVGQVYQNQENTNTQIENNYRNLLGKAMGQDVMSNMEIDRYNLENKYNYDLWRTGAKNKMIADLGNTSGQLFGKMTDFNNQLSLANILANQYDSSVIADQIAGNKQLADIYLAQGKISQKDYDRIKHTFACGGTIRSLRKFPNGGNINNEYRKKLQTVINEETINNAQLMDDEYAAALESGKDKYTSSVTGLDYKVLPKAEKHLLAANMWKETHGTAPTKKQEEATVKAIEGKATGSTKAKIVAETVNNGKTMADIVNSKWSNQKPEGYVSKQQLPINQSNDQFNWREFAKSQGAQLIDAVGSLGLSAIGNPLYHEFGVDLSEYGIPHTDLSREAVDEKVKNPNEYADAASNAMLGIMTGKLAGMGANQIVKSAIPKPKPKYYKNNEVDELLLKQKTKVGKNSYKGRQNKTNEKNLDYWNDYQSLEFALKRKSPEFQKKLTNRISKMEDENLPNDLLNFKLDNYEIPSFQQLKLKEMGKDLQKAKNEGNIVQYAEILKEMQKYIKSFQKKRSLK